jgi:hypothetical protein
MTQVNSLGNDNVNTELQCPSMETVHAPSGCNLFHYSSVKKSLPFEIVDRKPMNVFQREPGRAHTNSPLLNMIQTLVEFIGIR